MEFSIHPQLLSPMATSGFLLNEGIMSPERYIPVMHDVLELARRGHGSVSPNPMVGAVILSPEGNRIGEGYHRRYGDSHAEVAAIRSCGGRDLEGATLVVNLEPCCHQGKTPPCVDAIIGSGIKEVVVSTLDPNPKMNGKGIARLRSSGINVILGTLEDEARYLNRGYFSHRLRKRAWCAVKVAVSLDGRMANKDGQSKWITGPEARRLAHQLRADHDGILVGGGTVRFDDPELTVRSVPGVNPVRVVLSSHFGIPIDSKLARNSDQVRTILLTGESINTPGSELDSVEIVRIPERKNGSIDPVEILRLLPQYGVLSLLIEGGSSVLSSFMTAGVIDEMYIGMAPSVVGQGLSPFETFSPKSWETRPRYNTLSVDRLGDDVVVRYKREGDLFSLD